MKIHMVGRVRKISYCGVTVIGYKTQKENRELLDMDWENVDCKACIRLRQELKTKKKEKK